MTSRECITARRRSPLHGEAPRPRGGRDQRPDLAKSSARGAFRWILRAACVSVREVIRVALYGLGLATISSCVIGRATRPSLAESAQGPLAPPVSGSPLVPQTAPPDGEVPPEKGKPGATWVRGYWHWDGVRYVWQRGRFQNDVAQSSAPPTR
jgi:hypothetical protein